MAVTGIFCTKCGNQGRWVCTHTDDTHEDSSTSARRSLVHVDVNKQQRWSRSPDRYDTNFGQRRSLYHHDSHSHSRSPGYYSGTSQPNSPHERVSWQYPAPPNPVAKLSRLDSISAFLEDAEWTETAFQTDNTVYWSKHLWSAILFMKLCQS